MNTNQPILSCAGREAVSVDAALLTELLLSFTPNTIGITNKALNVSQDLKAIANGHFPDNALERFKEIITKEFLMVQLMEAAQLARQIPARTACDVPSLGDM